MYQITREQARQIVRICSECIQHLTVPHLGVNSGGLLPNAIWQMDATHLTEFSHLNYIHVSIGTNSGFIFASLQIGETTKYVISHLLAAFSAMGSPHQN